VLVGERAGAGSITAASLLTDAVGGSLAYVPRRAGARGAMQAGLTAGTLPGGRRLDAADDRAAVEAVWATELPEEPGRDLHAILTDAAAGRIDVLHLIGVDLARDAASVELARAALTKVKTVIVQDLAWNDTVREFADVVLPVSGRQERAGTATNWEGRAQRFSRAIDGPDLVQDDWEILLQLAAILGQDLGFNDLEALRAEVDRLGVRDEPHAMPAAAADAKLEDGEAAGEGFDVVARPLLLDNGTMLTGATDLLATAREPVVVVASSDAAELDVSDGDRVELTGGGGALTLPVRVTTNLQPGTVVVPTNAADQPAGVLADRDGNLRVTLTKVAAEQPTGEHSQEVA